MAARQAMLWITEQTWQTRDVGANLRPPILAIGQVCFVYVQHRGMSHRFREDVELRLNDFTHRLGKRLRFKDFSVGVETTRTIQGLEYVRGCEFCNN